MPLAGWIDAGVVMLRDGADALWQRLLSAAFDAETSEDVELAFAALGAEAAYRRRMHDEAEAKQRAEDAPHHFASVTQEQMDAAILEVSSWAGVKTEPGEDD